MYVGSSYVLKIFKENTCIESVIFAIYSNFHQLGVSQVALTIQANHSLKYKAKYEVDYEIVYFLKVSLHFLYDFSTTVYNTYFQK